VRCGLEEKLLVLSMMEATHAYIDARCIKDLLTGPDSSEISSLSKCDEASPKG